MLTFPQDRRKSRTPTGAAGSRTVVEGLIWPFSLEFWRKYSLLIPNDPDWNERITDATATTLSSLVSTGAKQIKYTYDMGDYWQHRIIVEKLMPAEPEARYPQFLGGERRCPPEDCGGFPGYYEFLDNIASRQSKNRKAALDWYGGPYDPDDTDEKQIVAALKRIAGGRRPRRPKSS